MINFKRALAFTLQWEGGKVDDPDDRGGRTNRGVTQRTYDAWRKSVGRPKRDVFLIEGDEVHAIYFERYWKAAHCDQDGALTSVVMFDIAVNHGVGRIRQWMKVVNALPHDLRDTDIEFARALIDIRVNFYYAIVKRNPTQRKFLKGWLNRARALKKEVGY